MAIKLDDFGTVQGRVSYAGIVQDNAYARHSAGMQRLGQGITQVGLGLQEVSDEMERVKTVGQRAELYRGLDAFHRDTMQEISASGQSGVTLEQAWNTACDKKLPGYLPKNLSAIPKEELAEAMEKLKYTGGVQARGMDQLALVKQARAAWESNINDAISQGDEQGAAQAVRGGVGIFIPEQNAERAVEERVREIKVNKALEETRAKPLAALKALDAGSLWKEADEGVQKTLRDSAEGELALAKSEFAQLVSRDCVRDERLTQIARNAGWLHESMGSTAPIKLTSNMRLQWQRLADSADDGNADDVRIAVAYSHLPEKEKTMLQNRVNAAVLVPIDRRQSIFSSIDAMQESGFWGAPGDESSVKMALDCRENIWDRLSQGEKMTVNDVMAEIEGLRKEAEQAWISSADLADMVKKA